MPAISVEEFQEAIEDHVHWGAPNYVYTLNYELIDGYSNVMYFDAEHDALAYYETIVDQVASVSLTQETSITII